MKNIRQSILLLAVTFFLSAIASAQYSVNEMRISNADVDLIKKTPLVVVLLDENASYIKKLERKEKAEELAKYKKIINDFNNNIGHMISKELPFIKAEYKHLEEIKKMTVQERQKLVIMPVRKQALRSIKGGSHILSISTLSLYGF